MVLAYAIRVPFKRDYHILFISYALACVCFAFVIAYANAQLSPQANYNIARFALLVGPRVQLALLYHCTLNFETRKMSAFQKVTVIGAYADAILLGVGNAVIPELSISPGRLTATGVTPGVGLIGAYLRIPGTPLDAYYLVVEVLILFALFNYYQHAKSDLVRVQIRYLSVGAFFDYLGVAALGIAVVFVGSGVPNFQSLITAVGTVVLLIGITRHGMYGITPAVEQVAHVDVGYEIRDGHIYLGLDKKTSLTVFSALVRNGRNGLCITTSPPDEVRTKFDLERTPIMWLADSERDDAVSPSDLVGMFDAVLKFVQKTEKPIVMLDGVDLLVAENGFRPTMSFINELGTGTSRRNGVLLISSMASPTAQEGRAFVEILETPALLQAQIKAPPTVEVGETFPLQIDLFNVSKRLAFLDRVDNLIPKRFVPVGEQSNLKVEGSSLALGGRRLEPLRLESLKVMLQAEEPGEETVAPRITYRSDEGVASTHEVEPFSIRVLRPQEIEFESEQGRVVFLYLAKAFVDDHMDRRYPVEQSGWRTLTQVSKETGIPQSTLYGREGRYGQSVYELLSRALIEQRVFTEQRGRGGESAKYRISYDRDPVRRYIDRTVLRRK